MTSAHNSTRRTMMAALAALPLGAAMAASNAPSDDLRQVGSRTLVAYFSRSGNTRVVAGLIAQLETGESSFFSYRDPAMVKWMSERRLDT